MPNKFFSNFPLMNYNGANCVNITDRVALIQSVFMNAYLYYPYDLVADERADQFANRYYGDPYESWLIYLSNQIYDPIRQWYQPVDVFNNLIIEKYGSLQAAIQKTKFYRNNWMNGDAISVSRYDALTPLLQEYYQANTFGNRIVSYLRRPVDWTLNTNRILAYTVNNPEFIEDEIVNIAFNSNNTGQGQVLSIDTSSNTVYVQHVNGVFITASTFLEDEGQNFIQTENADYIRVDGDSYLYGTESFTNTVFSTYSNGIFIQSRVVAENLDASEDVFWTPVSYYDYENESNEFNKTLRILDVKYASTAVKNFQGIFSS